MVKVDPVARAAGQPGSQPNALVMPLFRVGGCGGKGDQWDCPRKETRYTTQVCQAHMRSHKLPLFPRVLLRHLRKHVEGQHRRWNDRCRGSWALNPNVTLGRMATAVRRQRGLVATEE